MILVESILGSGAYRNSFRFFQDAAVRMENTLGCSPMDITKFSALGQRAQDVALVNLKKDEDYDDAPDEFIGEKLTLTGITQQLPPINTLSGISQS